MINCRNTNRPRLISASLSLSVATGLMVGCSISPTVQGQDSNTEPKKKSALIKNKVPSYYYPASSPVVLHVVIRNTHNDTMKFIDGNTERALKISVKDSSGKDVPLTRYGDHLLNPPPQPFIKSNPRAYSLKKGEEHEYRILLNQIYDMSVSEIYSVKASKAVRLSSSGQGLTVASASVNIEIGGFDGSKPHRGKDNSVKVDVR